MKGRKSSGRDAGGFVALPWSVLDSHAYRNCSANARSLLIEVARQFHRDDNGRMLLSRAYLNKRGWTSSDMITKAKRELLDNRLIHETVKGQRPRKAGWYAITWQALDRLPGLDPDAVLTFRRGAYRDVPPKFAVPHHGTQRLQVAPPHGTETPSAVPLHGAIRPEKRPASVPPHGHPLEIPSTEPRSEARSPKKRPARSASSASREDPEGGRDSSASTQAGRQHIEREKSVSNEGTLIESSPL